MTILYHYTSLEGFKGIVETKKIWAANNDYLNDISEIKYASELLQGCLGEYDNKTLPEEVVTSVMQQDHYKKFGDLMFSYICSFSEDPDLLSQWRAYGANGKGVCLGFSLEKLKGCVEKCGFAIKPCIYQKDQQKKAICDLLSPFIKHSASGIGFLSNTSHKKP